MLVNIYHIFYNEYAHSESLMTLYVSIKNIQFRLNGVMQPA